MSESTVITQCCVFSVCDKKKYPCSRNLCWQPAETPAGKSSLFWRNAQCTIIDVKDTCTKAKTIHHFFVVLCAAWCKMSRIIKSFFIIPNFWVQLVILQTLGTCSYSPTDAFWEHIACRRSASWCKVISDVFLPDLCDSNAHLTTLTNIYTQSCLATVTL